jgi:hypothetical protein
MCIDSRSLPLLATLARVPHPLLHWHGPIPTDCSYMATEKLMVSVGGDVVVRALDPFDSAFFQHRIEFVATQTSLRLNFTNMSPANVDNSVFIDEVTVCPAPPGCISVHNPDFEHDAPGVGYSYQSVLGWVSVTSNGIVLVANGNSAWGGLDSGNGAYYLVMQRTGSGVQQQVTGLAPGVTYNISFLAAERPGYGTNERLVVLVNNQPLSIGASAVREVDPTATGFRRYSATFVAAASGRNLVSFENTSPNSTQDRSVFLDGVQICGVPGVPVNPHPGCSVVSGSSASGGGGGSATAATTAAVLLGIVLVAVMGVLVFHRYRGAVPYRLLSISAEHTDGHTSATADDFDTDPESVQA